MNSKSLTLNVLLSDKSRSPNLPAHKVQPKPPPSPTHAPAGPIAGPTGGPAGPRPGHPSNSSATFHTDTFKPNSSAAQPPPNRQMAPPNFNAATPTNPNKLSSSMQQQPSLFASAQNPESPTSLPNKTSTVNRPNGNPGSSLAALMGGGAAGGNSPTSIGDILSQAKQQQQQEARMQPPSFGVTPAGGRTTPSYMREEAKPAPVPRTASADRRVSDRLNPGFAGGEMLDSSDVGGGGGAGGGLGGGLAALMGGMAGGRTSPRPSAALQQRQAKTNASSPYDTNNCDTFVEPRQTRGNALYSAPASQPQQPQQPQVGSSPYGGGGISGGAGSGFGGGGGNRYSNPDKPGGVGASGGGFFGNEASGGAAGGYNFQRIMDDHFEHYRRPPSRAPSREASVDRMPHSLEAAGGAFGGGFASSRPPSRPPSRTRTPQQRPGGAAVTSVDDFKVPATSSTANGDTGAAASGGHFDQGLRYRGGQPSQEISNLGTVPKRTESLYMKYGGEANKVRTL